MCGIVGYYDIEATEENDGGLRATLGLLRNESNRGRDGWGIGQPNVAGTFDIHLSLIAVDEDRAFQAPPPKLLTQFNSNLMLAQNRYATSGEVTRQNAQPMQNDPDGLLPPHLRFCFVFNGNIANTLKLQKELEDEGVTFSRSPNDTQVLLRLIESIMKRQTNQGANPVNYETVFREVDRRIDGACSLIMADGLKNMVVYRDKTGLRPLEVIYEYGKMIAVSETYALRGIHGQTQSVTPGTILYYDKAQKSLFQKDVNEAVAGHTHAIFARPLTPACPLEYTYLLNAQSEVVVRNAQNEICRRTIYEMRMELGRVTAIEKLVPLLESFSNEQRKKVRIMAIPQTAKPCAIGIYRELNRRGLLPPDAYSEGIIYEGGGRSFNAIEGLRQRTVADKLSPVPSEMRGRIVLEVDDSLIRGTTIDYLVPASRNAGAEAVYGVSCSPPLIGIDCYGIDLPNIVKHAFWNVWDSATPKEQSRLFRYDADGTVHIDQELYEKKLAEAKGADGIVFLSLDGYRSCLPDHVSMHVFTGQYPTREGQHIFNQILGDKFHHATPV
jgi:glutamine phosphoribosylpyrophosphate amidotransferase